MDPIEFLIPKNNTNSISTIIKQFKDTFRASNAGERYDIFVGPHLEYIKIVIVKKEQQC